MLVILNEHSAKKIIDLFNEHKYYGFDKSNVFFMIQKSYHGINFTEEGFVYDKKTPKRLHNHGQMVMQQTMDDQIFNINLSGKRNYLKAEDFGKILQDMQDKQSYNIEDLGFLMSAIDYESLALALSKSDEGYRIQGN